MIEINIKEIIKKHKHEIKYFRELLFPLMHFNVITGFNVYENKPRPECNFAVNYLHSELDEDKAHSRN